MFTRMLCLLLAGASGAASAQSVYKCRQADGAVVYQSIACEGRTEKQWTPDPAVAASRSSAMERAAAAQKIERDRQALKASHRPAVTNRRTTRTSSIPREPRPSACERERAARAAAHARRGVRWSYAEASYWDARVFKVCR